MQAQSLNEMTKFDIKLKRNERYDYNVRAPDIFQHEGSGIPIDAFYKMH